VGVELRVALPLFDEHVIKWRPVVRRIQSGSVKMEISQRLLASLLHWGVTWEW
jgi:hypothetical protein